MPVTPPTGAEPIPTDGFTLYPPPLLVMVIFLITPVAIPVTAVACDAVQPNSMFVYNLESY